MSSVRTLYRIFQQLRDTFRSKELVGVDKRGNKYYRWYEQRGGKRQERREVKTAGPSYMYEPHSLTGEWRLWLRKTRQDPPTEEESAKSEAKAAAMRQNVQLIEKREKMRRLQMQSMGNARAGSANSVEAFLQGMSQQPGYTSDKQSQGSSKAGL